ncbi:MAG: hypothetical protein ACQEW8_11515 [Actinomycetota bacterium]
MSALDTRPTPLHRTLPAPHEHGWLVESRHATSEGTILYVRCAACGALRVDRHVAHAAAPEAVSRESATRAPRIAVRP